MMRFSTAILIRCMDFTRMQYFGSELQVGALTLKGGTASVNVGVDARSGGSVHFSTPCSTQLQPVLCDGLSNPQTFVGDEFGTLRALTYGYLQFDAQGAQFTSDALMSALQGIGPSVQPFLFMGFWNEYGGMHLGTTSLTPIQSVPEPKAIWLLASSGLGLLWYRRARAAAGTRSVRL